MNVKPPPTRTSYGAILGTETERREVRIPRRGELPESVAWIKDPALGIDVPAVIGITGQYIGIGVDEDEKEVSQWRILIRPDSPRLNQRFVREDLRDIISTLHTELTARDPKKGATYTAYFSVPKTGEDNILDVTFRGAPINQRDPWLKDDNVFHDIHDMLCVRLNAVCLNLWNSWIKDPEVAKRLREQGVPVAPNACTQFLTGNDPERIRRMVPDASRHTLITVDEIGGENVRPLHALDKPAQGKTSSQVAHHHLAVLLGSVTSIAVFLLLLRSCLA